MAGTLLFDLSPEGIATITINRPEAHNALDLETMRQFAGLIPPLAHDSRVRALILTGAGRVAFCSGGDVVELSRHPSAEDAAYMIGLMGEALLALERLPVPVIAAINGYALGGGSEIAVACDLRIMEEQARMGFVQARMGLTPGWGGGQRLMRLAGYAKALEILLDARAMNPQDLLACGLVNRVVPTGEALPQALELAQRVAQLPASVVRTIKSLLQTGTNQPYERALRHERALFPALWASEAHRNAVEQFLNRDRR